MLRDLLATVSASVFPMVCPGCGGRGDPVCPACERSLTAAPAAPPPSEIDAWVAPFAYEGVAREVVARVKYRGAHGAVTWLAREMARVADRSGLTGAVDIVTWAPTTAGRRQDRGFDHAELLARAVARALRIRGRATLRRAPGPAQTGRPAAARRRGPVFVARGPAPRRVLLVDDVATTGATLSAAAAALRRSGATHVVAVTAARTPHSRHGGAVAASHATTASTPGDPTRRLG